MNITKPKIEINGKVYEMNKPKGIFWRKYFKFDEERRSIPVSEYIDKHCEFLAEWFDDLSAEDMLNNLTIDEIIKLYKNCLNWLLETASDKFGDEKNEVTGEALDQ